LRKKSFGTNQDFSWLKSTLKRISL
jgi:hypothetical protein